MSEEGFRLKVSIENGEVHIHGNRAQGCEIWLVSVKD